MVWKQSYEVMDKGLHSGNQVANIRNTRLVDDLDLCQPSIVTGVWWKHTRASNPKLLSRERMIPIQKRMASTFPISMEGGESMPLV
jgi:hypothetical protein